MIVVLTVVVCVLCLTTALLFAALIELFRDLRQLREQTDLMDSANSIPIPSLEGKRVSDLTHEFDSIVTQVGRAGILLLSNGCGTCRTLAHSLDGVVIPNLATVLYPGSDNASQETLNSTYQLEGVGLIIDRYGQIADALKVHTTPCLLFLEDGRFDSAETIPTVRILKAKLAELQSNRGVVANVSD